MLTVNQIDDLTRAESPVVALAVGPDGTLVGPVAQIPERWAQRATEFVSNVEWKPKPGAVRFVDGIGDGLVLCLVGVGAPTSASDVGQIDRPGGDQPGGDQADAAGGPHDLELLRRAAATVVARCQQRTSVALAIASTEDEMVASIEGALLGSYRFVEFKGALTTQPAPQLASIEVLTPVSDRGAEESPRDRSSWTVDNAIAACQATIQARDWVNADGASLPPEVFADAARELLESAGLAVEVWDEHRLASERCGGILGVGQGSSRPPRLVIASYEAPNPVGSVTLVGKGVTFDSGGLSLKSGEGMMTMKCDMGGAAAVIAALAIVPIVAPNLSVRGVIPMAENLPGGRAIRPGDVLRTRSGATVEVLNTDAEGRLILADALTIASEGEPDLIIDLATLTGACIVALGPDIAGVMEVKQSAAADLIAAGDAAGEAFWQLPLPARYRSLLDSTVADLRNIGTNRNGGTLTAGLFLSSFVGDHCWTHVDIAGPAFVDKPSGYLSAGGTGFGVRTLARALSEWSAAGQLPHSADR